VTDSNEDDDKLAIPPDIDDDDDEDDDDEDEDDRDITDVWDEEMVRAALGDPAPDVQTGPATAPTGERRASVEISAPDVVRPPADPKQQEGPGSAADTDPPPPAAWSGLSWPLTIGLALTLAVAMYLLVRVLKG